MKKQTKTPTANTELGDKYYKTSCALYCLPHCTNYIAT